LVDDDAGAAVTTRSVNARVPALTQPPVRPGRAVAAEGGGWYVDADGVVAAARR